MTTMGSRIKKVRQDNNLTQVKFGQCIGLKQNSIAIIESGKRDTSDQTILAICRTFHIREEWLREGIGPMLQPSSNIDQVKEWLKDVFEKGSRFEKSFISSMSQFTDEDWELLERLLRKIKTEQATQSAPSAQICEEKKPDGLTDEEWAMVQRHRTAKDGSNMAAGSWDTDEPA